MTRLVVAFPVSKESSADAYLAFVNDVNNCPEQPFYGIRYDKHGQRIVAYLGPEGFTWNDLPFPEPVGGPAARADGVLVGTVEWPEEE